MSPNQRNTFRQEENMNNENIDHESVIRIIRILLDQVKNCQKKATFNQRLTSAVLTDNSSALNALMTDLGNYITSMSNRTAREATKKEPVYQEPPTFDQAVSDLIHQWCADLEKFPDLNEYYASVEKTLFEEVDNPHRKARGGKNSKKKEEEKRSFETIVKKDMVVISADTQSGKSKAMICAGIKGMLKRKIPVFVTRNVTGDADQLQCGCENFSKILDAYLTKHGVTERKFTIETIRGDSLEKQSNKQIVSDAFDGKCLKMIICLGNAIQLRRVLDLTKKAKGQIELFIDEADYVDYGEGSETSEILKELKDYAYQTVMITATPLAVMFNEEELKAKNQLRLQPPSDYRGFVDIAYKPFAKEASCLNNPSTYSEMTKADPNLEPFLKKFSRSKPFYAYKLKENIPEICLIKNSRFIENHESLFNGIVKKYKDMAVMVYNGSGVKMHVPGENFEGYQKMNISEALQYLRDNGGVKKFKNIVIIAGDLAGRCISYVPKDYSWHLTKMYYLPATSTSIPDLIQSAGRLCGRNRGKGSLELHAPLKVIDSLFKGFKFTNEIIDRAIASPAMNDEGVEKSFADSLKSIPMNKNKAPPASRKLVTKADVKKSDFNLVEGKDGGVPMSKYEYKTEEVEEPVKEEKEEEVGEGKYFLILEDKITAPLAKKILDEVDTIMFKTGKTGKIFSRTWINQKLVESGEFSDIQKLNGHWNLSIMKKSVPVENKNAYGLIFWKGENGQYYMQMNA